MELHRLKTMKDGYPVSLFNKLYEETKYLRKSLSYQIDSRRYGVTPDIIESWFDDKFIFVFNKYFTEKDPDILKGFIINSLKTFKFRILRKAYNKEGLFYSSIIELEGDSQLINIIPDTSFQTTDDVFHNTLFEFMQSKLNDNAFLIFSIQMDPPPYIIQRLTTNRSRIPNDLIAEYLGINMGDDYSTDKYIKSLKKQINKTIKSAKEYFQTENPLALN